MDILSACYMLLLPSSCWSRFIEIPAAAKLICIIDINLSSSIDIPQCTDIDVDNSTRQCGSKLKVSVGIQDIILVDVANLTVKKYSQNVTIKDQVSFRTMQR